MKNCKSFASIACLAILVQGWFSPVSQLMADPASRELQLPEQLADYTHPQRPSAFDLADGTAFDTVPEDNPITDAGATLGRVLFYDTQLSANYSTSCGSCHLQKYSFSDPRPVSVGYKGRELDRNGMALNDLRFVRAGFFWDERIDTLEEAVVQPIFSQVEMGLTPELLEKRLSADKRYAPLFREAFGEDGVSTEKVARALAQFIRAMETGKSRYDQAVAEVSSSRDDFPQFTQSENLGKRIFFDKCSICHHLGTEDRVVNFSMFRSLNNGIDADGYVRDGGRADVTLNPTELGLFKASSLRNVEFTAPYMHDGRFPTLEDVIEHYSTGVKRHPEMGPVLRFQFTETEKQALVDFLKTLSDSTFLTDPRFSDPWITPESKQTSLAIKHSPSNSTRLNRSPTQFHTTKLQRLLDQGAGIPADATLPWLISLDVDQDGTLNEKEWTPVIGVLLRTGALESRSPVRKAAMRFQKVQPGEDEGPSSGSRSGRTDASKPAAIDPSLGDLDGDGQVSQEEAEHHRALTRFAKSAGGGRLEVFLDRLLARFDFDRQLSASVRKQIKEVQQQWLTETRNRNQTVSRQLLTVLGPESYQQYQKMVVDRLVATGQRREKSANESDAEELIFWHDLDGDRVLNRQEIEEFAKTLASAPGGFGQNAPHKIDVDTLVDRYRLFDLNNDAHIALEELPERIRSRMVEGDTDGDGLLSPDEIREYVRAAAFLQLLEFGIYTGGGFSNALVWSKDVVNDIDLPTSQRMQAQLRLQEHEEWLNEQAEEVLRAHVAVLKAAWQQRSREPNE